MPAIDIDEDSLVLSTHPDLEVSHAGFISELKESGKDSDLLRCRNGNVERTWIVREGGSSGWRDQDSVCKQIDAGWYSQTQSEIRGWVCLIGHDLESRWARTTWTRRGFFYGSRANGEGIVVFGYCDSVFLYLYFTHILCDENTRGNLLSFTAVGKRKRSETRSINPERDSHSNVFSVDFTCVCVFVWINKQGKSTLNTFGAKKHAIREACSCFQWMANFHIAGSNWITPTWPKQSNPIRLCYLEV